MQSLQTGRFLVHVSINQLTYTAVDCVTQSRHEVFLQIYAAFDRTQRGCGVRDVAKSSVNPGNDRVQTSKISVGYCGNIKIRNAVAGDVGQSGKAAVLAGAPIPNANVCLSSLLSTGPSSACQ